MNMFEIVGLVALAFKDQLARLETLLDVPFQAIAVVIFEAAILFVRVEAKDSKVIYEELVKT